MYVKVRNGVAENYSIGQLRKDNPNVSFPKNITNDELARWDVYPVQPQNPPAFDRATQDCVRVSPTLQNGVWVETWSITSVSAEESARRVAEISVQVRAQRDRLLVESDWTQVLDAPVDRAVWATYRQSLRDVTLQAGFPSNVTWPSKPE